ncbi:AAA family ATPase [Lentinula detonsa]|uniref:AAA family ATPase n=1 Tax=Lentinula detonsa TaxID=2804962 RepID=A0AA38Q9L1_9AGAR|nr:AAA family ATPase [Lentinula detonsa]
MSLSKFTVYVTEQSSSSPRAARRVILNADILKNLKLTTGDVIAVFKSEEPLKAFAVGIVWPSLEQPSNSITLSTALLLTAQLEPGQHASVFALSSSTTSKPPARLPSIKQVKDATIVKLKEVAIPDQASTSSTKKSNEKEKDWLPLLLRESLVDIKYLTSTQTLQITYEGKPRRFSVIAVAAAADFPKTNTIDHLSERFEALGVESRPSIWTVSWDTVINITENQTKREVSQTQKPDIEVLQQRPENNGYASIGGLDKQIAEIKDLLEIPLTRPDLFRYFNLKPPRGILLHGPPGTGKTHLARAIAASTKSSVIVVNGPELSSAYHGETESKLRDVFKEARDRSPCIVVLDEVDALVPQRGEGGSEVEKRVVATLLTILDGMEDDSADHNRVIVIGTTNRPNAIDPALRRPGRFDREIEIGVPDADARLSILKTLLSRTPNDISAEDLRAVASRAHGYVGADLAAVVREAGTLSIKLWLSSTSENPENQQRMPFVTLSDIMSTLPAIRPSAMRSLFVDTPPIRYSDVGGQSHVIAKLRETVEWPLLHPEAFQRLGVKPPKGILLYGPPGCSKTVLARACACESGVNFVAVKGPELLNKFVGESERAVREIFRKARAASPSIIFFDEIDALATSRTSSDSNVGTSNEGVLTSLLNEIDGVQELVGVTILAATNRPESIDSALMRPGRLDRILYVGPPDQEGREEIMRIRTKHMKVEENLDISQIATLTEGCSGAEISALCQEAALLTMQKDIDAPFVPQEAFVAAAKSIQRQITPSMLKKFQLWRTQSGSQVT